MGDLVSIFNLDQNALGHLTSAVQFGFIIGTLIFAFLMIADRFAPSTVFFVCAIIGGLFNLGIIFEINVFWSLILLRFLTGFFLAGIYPVGMKIAADYYEKGLGKSLGFLVGALVLGTAFPHFLKGFSGIIPWEYVIIITSSLAIIGGILMFLFVPNGPYRKSSQKIDISALFKIFKVRKFRSAAFGYFGHMWELYAFWAFIPIILTTYNSLHPSALINIPLWSFLIIAIGSIACVLGGYLSMIYGTKKIATLALVMSGDRSNPPSSVQVDDRAVPNSSRPFDRWSRKAARSATRMGWLILGTQTMAPWHKRIFSVCMAAAAKNNSGAEECEYSSRKWCSTTQTWSKPSSSASLACSSALKIASFSCARVKGRGTDISKNNPNSISGPLVGCLDANSCI